MDTCSTTNDSIIIMALYSGFKIFIIIANMLYTIHSWKIFKPLSPALTQNRRLNYIPRRYLLLLSSCHTIQTVHSRSIRAFSFTISLIAPLLSIWWTNTRRLSYASYTAVAFQNKSTSDANKLPNFNNICERPNNSRTRWTIKIPTHDELSLTKLNFSLDHS